jgi:chromosome partitioning protein
MAKKVSLINMKGGVGKSTLAVNLAWHFAAKSNWVKKVLVIDLDPQFNASQYLLGVSEYDKIIKGNIPTIWNVFEQFTPLPGLPMPSPLDPTKIIYNVRKFHSGSCIDLIPSRLELAFSLRNPGQKEQLLAKLLSKIEEEYELIILDCPPTESLFTWAAYLTSNWILVPVKPEYLSSIGVSLLINSMEEFKRRYEDHNLQLAGIVFNATTEYVPEEVKSKNEVRAIALKNGWYVFENEVPYSRSYPKGAREGLPIFRTSYSRWTQADRFSRFAEEFALRIGLGL